jgi:hypothetical protein
MIPISWWDLSNIPVWEYFNISLVQAHNELGFSVPNTIIIKTKRDGRPKPDITPPSMAQASDASWSVWSNPIHSLLFLLLLLAV